MEKRPDLNFFLQDVLIVAPGLLGKTLVRVYPYGKKEKYIITETEAYRGEEDKACHASKGRDQTNRNNVSGWRLYLYLSYLWNVLDAEFRYRFQKIYLRLY